MPVVTKIDAIKYSEVIEDMTDEEVAQEDIQEDEDTEQDAEDEV